MDINDIGNKVWLQKCGYTDKICRHPDDIKLFCGEVENQEEIQDKDREMPKFVSEFGYNEFIDDEYDYDNSNFVFKRTNAQPQLRRSERRRVPNKQYFNENFVLN